MQTLKIGDVTITSIIERDGPWRATRGHVPGLRSRDRQAPPRRTRSVDVRSPIRPAGDHLPDLCGAHAKHTILVDTCTGEDKGYPPPMDFPKQPWLDGFRAAGLRFEDIDYVFCTHLHIDHCGWNTVLRDGRWVPTFPNAKYVFHKREYAAWEEATKRGDTPPGNVWRFNCEPVVAAGQALLVDDDFQLDDTICVDTDARPFAVPLLRQYPLPRAARGHRRRPHAPRAAMPRAGLVDDLRLGPGSRRHARAETFSARSPGAGRSCCRSTFRIRPPGWSSRTASGSGTGSRGRPPHPAHAANTGGTRCG